MQNSELLLRLSRMSEIVAGLSATITRLMSELQERDWVLERELDSLGDRADRHREEIDEL